MASGDSLGEEVSCVRLMKCLRADLMLNAYSIMTKNALSQGHAGTNAKLL